MTGATAAYLAARPRLRAVRQELGAKVGDGAGLVWREMSPQVRTALVMLAVDPEGDARDYARRPWESYPEDQRLMLGAIAREFQRALSGAGALR